MLVPECETSLDFAAADDMTAQVMLMTTGILKHATAKLQSDHHQHTHRHETV